MSPTASSYSLVGRQMASPSNTNNGGLTTAQKIGIGVGVGVGMLMLLALLGAILYGCIKMKRTRSPKSAQNKQVYDSPQSQTASLQNNSQIDTSQYSETQQTQTYSHEPTTTPQTSQQQYEAPSSGHFMHSSTQTSAAPPVTTFSQGY